MMKNADRFEMNLIEAAKQALEALDYIYATSDDQQEKKIDAISALRAAIEEAEKAEIERLRVERDALKKDAAALWMMLDDIDTGGDIAKADNVLYRAIAERSHKRRFSPRFEWVLKYLDTTMEESK